MANEDKTYQYTLSVVEAVDSLFQEDSELSRYKWAEIDATKFFTAYIKAGCYIFNKITSDDKNVLEFTHLANQLVVQDMIETAEEEYRLR